MSRRAESTSSESRDWEWVAGIPLGGTRAETVPASLDQSVATSLIQLAPQGEIRLASTAMPREHNCRVVSIDGESTGNLQEFYLKAGELRASGKDLFQVAVQQEAAADPTTVEVSLAQLAELRQHVAGDQPSLRLQRGTSTRVLLRSNGISCEVTGRVERTRGLVLIDMAIENHSSSQVLAPREVRAYAGNSALRCMSADQTLRLLYGDSDQSIQATDELSASFASISESEDYLIPTSYRELEDSWSESTAGSSQFNHQPALAVIPGYDYPGSPILGDARALSGYLLQRNLMRPHDSAMDGWIVFAGPSLMTATEVTIEIDLGAGPRTVHLRMPY